MPPKARADLPFAPEFALAAACCHWPPSPERAEKVRAAAAGVDWALFGRVAARHRVEGLIADALRRADVEIPAAAQSIPLSAERIARQSLSLAAESVRLHRLFDAEGIPILFLKGVTLARLVYGTIALKMGMDIDILVRLPDVERAAQLLERVGYRLTEPEGERGRERLAFWHSNWKESVWVDAGRNIHLDLHTRLSDNPRVLPGVGMESVAETVEISRGMALPALGGDSLFAYLCVHGASSAWFRLKWLADVAALIAPCSDEEVDRLYRRSQELGAGRAAAQALLLIEAVFEQPLPPGLARELKADRVNRWLLTIGLRKLAGRSAVTEVRETRLGTASIHLMQLGLLPGWRFKLSELRRQLVSPYDQLAVPLPRALAFLYPLVFILRRLPRPGRRG